MSSLERRCRWLLLAYPAWYRRERGGEMLGFLLVTSPPGRQWPSFRDARALILGGLRVRGWVWRLTMLWVVMGAGGAGYALVCTIWGCTTSQCVNDEFLFPLYNGEPALIADVGALAATAWVLLAVPLLVAGFVRLHGWRRRNWPRTAAWASAWVAGFALMGLVAVAGAYGADSPGLGWGELELPIFAAWLALGVVQTQPAGRAGPLVPGPGRAWARDPLRDLRHGSEQLVRERRHGSEHWGVRGGVAALVVGPAAVPACAGIRGEALRGHTGRGAGRRFRGGAVGQSSNLV